MRLINFLILCGLSVPALLFSQHSWTAVGIKGGYGASYLINKNYWTDQNIENQITFGYMFGGRLSENFNDKNELSFECFSSLIRQNYIISDSVSASTVGMSYKTIDLALLYRNHNEGGYFEIGPQMSFIRKASPTSNIADNDPQTLTYFSPHYFSGVLGFGGNVMGSDNFDMLMGLRFIYGFSDIVSKNGGRSDALPNFPIRDSYTPKYSTYEPTNPFTILLMLEFNFDVGYFARATCNKNRRKFVTF